MIIALCGQKGGSGKTTTAIAIAAEFTARGRRVLLVDADPQGSARTWGALAAQRPPSPVIVAMGDTMHQRGQLDALAPRFDHVVIDCPPRHGEVQRSALAVADLAILPCGPSAVDAWALAESISLVRAAQERFPKLRAVGLITRKVARTTIGQNARAVLTSAGLTVLETEWHYRVAYQEAPATGMGIAQYAPSDPAAIEVGALVDELEGTKHVEKTSNRRRSATSAAVA